MERRQAVIVTLGPTRSFARINGVMCRRWTGRTSDGVPVAAWVARVMPLTIDPRELAAFDNALIETAPPTFEVIDDKSARA